MENENHIRELIGRYSQLSGVENEIAKAAECVIQCFQQGRKLLVCGNGGSSSDSDHIAGELMKSFEIKRPLHSQLRKGLTETDKKRGKYLAGKLQLGLPAISLTGQTSLLTAVANDMDPDLVFAQQIIAYGNAGDVLIAISTSGNSQNVIDATITARAKGMIVIGLTGESGGSMKPFCDILINVPGKRTADIQELHLPVYHALCRMVESSLFEEKQRL